MKRFLTFILVLFFVISSSAQVKLADILYDNFEYEIAAKLYEKADSLSQKQIKNHALCYYFKNEFHRSIPLFEKALSNDSNDIFLKYHYSISLKSVGRYVAARKILSKFHFNDSLNPYIKLHLNSIDSLMKWDTIKFFKRLAAFNELNTKSSEFSPLFHEKGIYYIVEKDFKKDKRRNIKLISRSDTLKFSEKRKFIKEIDSLLTYGRKISPKTYVYKYGVDVNRLFKDYSNPIPYNSLDSSTLIVKNKGFNITSYATTNNPRNIFYTRHPINNKWNPESVINPLLFTGLHKESKQKIKKRKILKIKSLPLRYGSGEISVTSDGNSVYFVSDKKNGFGGTDIYVAHKKASGGWSKAKNLGDKINTPFDEESPRIYDDSILYFSSNGWPGYGKSDIFRCKILNDSISNFEHLPYPINSSGEDINFSLHPFDESVGVMNSNRSKGKGDEDIYFAYMIPVEPYVKGYIRYLPDSSIQRDAFVKLFNINNHELNQTTTKINGVYRFSLKMDSSYKVCATKTGLSGCIQVNANESLFRNEKKDIYLDSAITFQGFIIDEKNKFVDNCKIEFFDQYDNLLNTIYSRHDGFFQIGVNKGDKLFVMATKKEKAGSTKVEINKNYKTDSTTNIRIYNNRAIIHGIVYDTNGLPSSNAVVRLLDSNRNEIERITTKTNGEYQLSMTTFRYYTIIATNYGMTKDTSFYVDLNWKPHQKKDLYLEAHKTVQGVTLFKDSNTIIDDAKVEIESGFDSKYISIYSDKNGFFQFPLNNDSLIFMISSKSKMSGSKTIKIDSNYNTKSLNNIYLHRTTTDAHGVVIYSKDSTAKGVEVELINKHGKLEKQTNTDSLGKFYFELKTDSDYEIYATDKNLEAVENIHTGVLWDKKDDIVLELKEKGTPTYGLVLDVENQLPIRFVKITITDSATNLKNITYSNDSGNFEMSLKRNTTNYLKLEKENYFTKTIIIKIGDTVPTIINLTKDYNLNLTKSNFRIDPIYFEFDSHKITAHSKIELKKLALWLENHKERICTIYGYTDCRGKQQYNLNLSKRRASTVSNYLSKNGINVKRIIIEARGATNYVNNCYLPSDCTEAEHRENRRCEFEINDKQ
tara:strand:+ start:3217 stop:6507 length:3291 start_codon:yes stop_codon:yes gene_type:complete